MSIESFPGPGEDDGSGGVIMDSAKTYVSPSPDQHESRRCSHHVHLECQRGLRRTTTDVE
jgi:hypothetical protein